jgi:hypothetical protein
MKRQLSKTFSLRNVSKQPLSANQPQSGTASALISPRKAPQPPPTPSPRIQSMQQAAATEECKTATLLSSDKDEAIKMLLAARGGFYPTNLLLSDDDDDSYTSDGSDYSGSDSAVHKELYSRTIGIKIQASAELEERATSRGIKMFIPECSTSRDPLNKCMSCLRSVRCKARASLIVFPETDYFGCPYIVCELCEEVADFSRIKELVDYVAIPLDVDMITNIVVMTDHGMANIFNIRWTKVTLRYEVDLKNDEYMFMRTMKELHELNPLLLEMLRAIVFWPKNYPRCLRAHFLDEVERCFRQRM